MSRNNPQPGIASPPMADTDAMPFGKYKGTPMQEIPVSYLHWLWKEMKHDHQSPVADYIRRNLNALRAEDPDRIWT